MSESQREIEIDEVGAGMVLAADVADANGSVLISAGTELSEKLLAVLRRREVERVTVECEEELSDEQRLSRRQKVEQKLAAQYACFGDDEVMTLLAQMFERYHTRGLS